MARVFELRGLGGGELRSGGFQPRGVRALDPAARNLEGYLFPETYNLTRRMEAKALVGLMAARFLVVFGDELRAEAQSQGPRYARWSHWPRWWRRKPPARRNAPSSPRCISTGCASGWGCSATPPSSTRSSGQAGKRQPHAPGPALRLAVNTTATPGSRQARSPRRARRRLKRCCVPPRWTTSTSSAVTTAAMSSPPRLRSTTAT